MRSAKRLGSRVISIALKSEDIWRGQRTRVCRPLLIFYKNVLETCSLSNISIPLQMQTKKAYINMEKFFNKAVLLLCIMMAVSCQKMVDDGVDEDGDGKKQNLITFRISQIEQIPFASTELSSRATDITKLCSHIYLAVYDSGNKRLQYRSQDSSDKDFGKLSVSLDNGTYRVVILAYNNKNNPTATDPSKIGFGNNGKMSDTFLWSDDITVDKNLEKEVNMSRVVAMFRLVTTDNIPDNVAKMKFYYTGGSSTIDAMSGNGSVASKQEENIVVSETGKPGTFEVYTFPRDDANFLKMEVTALDANGNTVASRTFEDVPISRNKITQYTGEFFSGGTSGSSDTSFKLTTNDEWSVIDKSY